MKGKISLILGILLLIDIVYKLVKCASCPSDYFGFEVSGYTYLGIQTLLVAILLFGAYIDRKKAQKAAGH